MDAHDSVRDKVQGIFQEWAGERANLLRGDVPARDANTILGQALARTHGVVKGDEIAFHLVDWNSDAAFIVAAILGEIAYAAPAECTDGYRGIWYMNQPTGDEYAYKYSGGFATYPQQQEPIAI